MRKNRLPFKPQAPILTIIELLFYNKKNHFPWDGGIMNITLTQQKDLKTRFPALTQSPPAALPTVLSLAALVAFELFHLSTTSFALNNLLGPAPHGGMAWSLVLGIAFCAVDIAGILNLAGNSNPAFRFKGRRWFFIAWVISLVFNIIITWWGLSTAIAIQQVHAGLIIDANLLMQVLPAFLAILLSLVRILIIGALVHIFTAPKNDMAFSGDNRLDSDFSILEPMDLPRIPGQGSLVPPQGFISPSGDYRINEPKYRHTPVRYRSL